MDKNITKYQQEVSPVVKQAENLKIKDEVSMKVAVELLSNCNKYLDKVTEEREKVTKPLNEALKAERARWKPIETNLDTVITMIRSKMSVYQTELVRVQKEKEAKVIKDLESGKIKKTETALSRLDKIETPEKEVATSAGLVQFRESRVLKITNEQLIPREYLIVDESKLLKDLKDGKQVLGAEIEVKLVPANYR